MTATISDMVLPRYERDAGTSLDPLAERQLFVNNEHLTVTHIERIADVDVIRVRVEDPFIREIRRANPKAVEYALADREVVQAAFMELEAQLAADPSDEMTARAKAQMYGKEDSTMRAWAKLMPTALALEPLQLPNQHLLPSGEFVDNDAFLRYAHSPDSIGIRTRAEIAQQLLIDHARRSNKPYPRWWSLGAGAMIPLSQGLQEIKTAVPEVTVHATAVDMSREVLEYASKKAEQFGLTDKDIETVVAHLIRDFLVTNPDGSNKLVERLGEHPDMIDVLGVFEYFDDKTAARLLKEVYRVLGDGGMVVFGNMLDTHPNLNVNQRAVGWPGIKPRSVERIKNIVIEAGIDLDQVTFIEADDGVYLVGAIEKPAYDDEHVVIDLEAHRRNRRRFGNFSLKQLWPGHHNGHNGHQQAA